MNNQCCGNCRFSYHKEGYHSDRGLDCRVKAPSVNSNNIGVWPTILLDAWCGEWKPKNEEKKPGFRERCESVLKPLNCPVCNNKVISVSLDPIGCEHCLEVNDRLGVGL